MIKIFKWLSRLVTLAIIVFVVWVGVSYFMSRLSSPPAIKDAPWAIQTFSTDGLEIPSRIYFAKDVRIESDGTPVAITYWTYDGRRYYKHNGEVAFTKTQYGDIDIVRRVK